jgi:hypothetical protein
MNKPLLDNSPKAKAELKALMRPENSFTLNISGWQLADPKYVKAETTVALTVFSEGLLSCGEPKCSAGVRSFGTKASTRSSFSAHKHGVVFHRRNTSL